MLLAQDISLIRSNITIINNINLSLGNGKMVVLKGKNGSGKTSLIKIILNLLEPSSGSIYWKGKDIKKNLNDFYDQVTYIPDNTTSLKQLTVIENIKIWSELSNEIIDKLHIPIKENLEILRISKIISERLEIYEQVFLINFIQIKWWRQTRNSKIIGKLETLKSHINNFIQPRLAWEVALLQIAKEDF